MAFKSLIRITSPPSPISADQTLLSSTLLELVRMRSEGASTVPTPTPPDSKGNAAANEDGKLLSEQCVLVLSLIDALPFLPIDSLDEWLPIAAQTVMALKDVAMRKTCEQRFWEVLISGEMDVDRAALCHSWWTSRGRREFRL